MSGGKRQRKRQIIMRNNDDIITGLASSVFQDSETKFQKEQDFGRKLFIAAWAVEIMAASLGLLIAGFVAFDAYTQNPDESGNSLLNAITGALPFALIAVIELTKIPLASGLYRVRNWGWKIFIAIALLALMLVTFETMFTGLERQMTNITARITDKKTEIQRFESQISENQRQIVQITNRDVENETADINGQIARAQEDGEKKILQLNEIHSTAVTESEKQIIDMGNQRLKLQNSLFSSYDTEIDSANERIKRLKEKLDTAVSRVDELQRKLDNNPEIKKLEQNNYDVRALMKETEVLLSSSEEARIKKGQVRIGVRPDGKFGGRTRRSLERWRDEQELKIEKNDLQIGKIQAELKDDLASAQKNSQNRRNERDAEEKGRQSLEMKRATAIGALTNDPLTPDLLLIEQRIDQARLGLQAEKERYSEQAERIRGETQGALNLLIAQRVQISDNINVAKQSLPELQGSITTLKSKIVTIQNEIRKDARNNQVYRFAQKWGQRTGPKLFDRKAYEDVLHVTEKDITKVGAFWFGSIAIICATIGTVLALIANIMTDPDAFVQKQKSLKIKPVRRGLRLLFLVVRKKLLKRREVIEREKIIEVEKLVEVKKEVEKIVEVEKIIEIEKEVEKEVERLVPEIIPIPIFIPSDADHEAEMGKASKYYDAINKTIDDAVKRSSE